jgi:heme/copper-type cytochrome/quinol oxidase subunit 4
MSGEPETGEKVETKPEKTKADKQAAHVERIERTAIACIIGIAAGILSFATGGTPNAAGIQDNSILAIFIMLAGVVIQRHIFMFMKMDTKKLGAKDWLFQGFMTFAFWFISWTILLTTYKP